MSDKQILKKAIEKAIKNGWKFRCEFYGKRLVELTNDPTEGYLHTFWSIIFRHDFAKAFWELEWQLHLKMMVLERNQIGRAHV